MALRLPRAPYFETGVKCYIYGQEELDYAAACAHCARKYDVDVLFIPSLMNLSAVAECFPELFVIAPCVDDLRPGRGMGMVLPEGLKAAGAAGALLNHCEKPSTLSQIRNGIARLRELEMLSFVCANTTEEAMALATLRPSILNPEPSELIGTGRSPDLEYVTRTVRAVKAVDASILTEIAAGVSRPEDVYDYIMAGSDAAGSASGILRAPDPEALLEGMVAATRQAADDRRAREAAK